MKQLYVLPIVLAALLATGCNFTDSRSADEIFTEALSHYEENNHRQAFLLIARAAYMDHGRAQFWMGDYYRAGSFHGQDGYNHLHTSRDIRKAEAWYKKAATNLQTGVDHDDAASMYWLAHLYHEGLGVTKDKKKSQQLLKRAERRNYHEANLLLGLHYLNDNDYIKALTTWKKAARQNFGPAYAMMAHLYLYGKGVPQDVAKYVDLMQHASKKGYEQADVELDQFLQGLRQGTEESQQILQDLEAKGLIQAT